MMHSWSGRKVQVMSACVFCAIAQGRSPAQVVYSDDDVVAFLDIRPITRGHTLVIPRRHSSGLTDLPSDLGGAMLSAAQLVAGGLRASSIGADGINLAVNDGRAAFQTVFHTHMHVVPRHTGDKLRFARGLLIRRDPTPQETAAAIRAGIEAA